MRFCRISDPHAQQIHDASSRHIILVIIKKTGCRCAKAPIHLFDQRRVDVVESIVRHRKWAFELGWIEAAGREVLREKGVLMIHWNIV